MWWPGGTIQWFIRPSPGLFVLPLTCSLSTILRIQRPCAFLLSPYMQVPSLPKHREAAERRGRGGKALSWVRQADRPLSCAPLSACERSLPDLFRSDLKTSSRNPVRRRQELERQSLAEARSRTGPVQG